MPHTDRQLLGHSTQTFTTLFCNDRLWDAYTIHIEAMGLRIARPKERCLRYLESGLHGASGHAVTKGGIANWGLWAPEGESTLGAQHACFHDCSRWPSPLWVIRPELQETCASRQWPARRALPFMPALLQVKLVAMIMHASSKDVQEGKNSLIWCRLHKGLQHWALQWQRELQHIWRQVHAQVWQLHLDVAATSAEFHRHAHLARL